MVRLVARYRGMTPADVIDASVRAAVVEAYSKLPKSFKRQVQPH